jgi:hypothetical protein
MNGLRIVFMHFFTMLLCVFCSLAANVDLRERLHHASSEQDMIRIVQELDERMKVSEVHFFFVEGLFLGGQAHDGIFLSFIYIHF